MLTKLPIKIPIDYELAPVINIIARDNLFGGLVKRSIGSSIIDLHQFMIGTGDYNENIWMLKQYKKSNFVNGAFSVHRMPPFKYLSPKREV